MSEPRTTHSVQLPPPPPLTKWEREYQAFLRLIPELMKTHEGKYVAIHEEKVVAAGDDKVVVALEAYRQIGYVEVYVGLVKNPPGERIRIPHYHLHIREVPS